MMRERASGQMLLNKVCINYNNKGTISPIIRFLYLYSKPQVDGPVEVWSERGPIVNSMYVDVMMCRTAL